jgi:hypothetical protein
MIEMDRELSSKRVILLWSLSFLAILGMFAALVAGLSAISVDEYYEDSYTGYKLCQ